LFSKADPAEKFMLSRVANSLYWMSRYLERAEHTTRVVDVNLVQMLDQSPTHAEQRWNRMLTSLVVSLQTWLRTTRKAS
jgi:uncharacterized alpha-E superfamily protein